jgi:hypothetical protein
MDSLGDRRQQTEVVINMNNHLDGGTDKFLTPILTKLC